jgi:carboxypeptidase Taq
LRRLHHERLTDPELGGLLADLTEALGDEAQGESVEADLVRVATRDHRRAVVVPSSLVAEMAAHQGETYEIWKAAREADDFDRVRPNLARQVELSRQLAECFPGYASIADPLIDFADEGLTAAWVQARFQELRERLVPLVKVLADRPAPDDACIKQHFPEDGQAQFGHQVVADLGYDFSRGRHDLTEHPFMIRLGLSDIRITTRYHSHDLGQGLFGSIHEAGHAMYEQGIDPALDGTPLCGGTSAGVHESQSRLWENIVGRSLAFWGHYYPTLQATFPDQLGDVPLDTFHRAVNRVERSRIRTEADEVTYNLHVMIRFELEVELLEGRLEVADLPERWREAYQASLGVEPKGHVDGVLQDVHWYAGPVGGEFQGYTLGNLMAAQLYRAALAARPEISDEIAAGRFDALREWLHSNVWRYGRRLEALDLVEKATGEPLGIDAYMAYLQEKYGRLYEL